MRLYYKFLRKSLKLWILLSPSWDFFSNLEATSWIARWADFINAEVISKQSSFDCLRNEVKFPVLEWIEGKDVRIEDWFVLFIDY